LVQSQMVDDVLAEPWREGDLEEKLSRNTSIIHVPR